MRGELARLEHRIAASTVWKILHGAGIDPAPRRSGPTWREFLTAQAEGIIAADFFHIDTTLGKRRYALAFLEHGTRCLHITSVTAHPTREWTVQQARNLTPDLGIRMESLRFLLRDRDGKYGEAFDAVFAGRGTGHRRTEEAPPPATPTRACASTDAPTKPPSTSTSC